MGHYYLFWKSFHIFGVILFLGNIIVTGVWKFFADLSRNWQIITFSQRLVTITDIYFTTIGVVIILMTGLLMASNYGEFWRIQWLAWGISLFILSGIIWVTILIPLQIKLRRLTTQHPGPDIPQLYWKYEKLWLIFGTIATLLPLINLYWMVFKPQ